jgi:hypothetical protein
VKVGLFTPGEAFEVVAKKRIMKLKEPATKMAALVAEELRIVLFNGLAKVGHGDLAKNYVSCFLGFVGNFVGDLIVSGCPLLWTQTALLH